MENFSNPSNPHAFADKSSAHASPKPAREENPLISQTDDGNICYVLHNPITVDGVTYKSLKLRAPCLNDLIRADKYKGNLEKVTAILVNITELPRNVIGRVTGKDIANLGKIVGDFLAEAPDPM